MYAQWVGLDAKLYWLCTGAVIMHIYVMKLPEALIPSLDSGVLIRNGP